MGLDTYIWRRGKTFHFRRRITRQNGDYRPISISMKTRDPDRARVLARRLASRWDMEMTMLEHSFAAPMTAAQRSQIFKMAMAEELMLATAHSLDRSTFDDAEEKRRARIYAAAYDEERQRYVRGAKPTLWDNLDEEDQKIAEKLHGVYVSRHTTERRIMPDYIEKLGIGVSEGNLFDAVKAHYSGKIEAQQRSAFLADPAVLARGDVTAALLDDDFITSLRLANSQGVNARINEATNPSAAPTIQIPQPSNDIECPFARRDERRFSEVIPHIIDKKLADKDWKAKTGDQNRILHIFAWVTGDKQLCEYRQTDISTFVAAYEEAPAGFRWMDHIKAKPQLPWTTVKAGFPEKRGETRSAATFNRDVGVLQAACKVLGAEDGPWEPRSGDRLVLAAGKRKTIDQPDPLDPKRMPWTPAHLEALFNLNLYTGGGGHLRRLEASHMPTVWHDAAFWVPMAGAYSGGVLNELCGLEIRDVNLDCAIPHFLIRDNMTRSKDGVERAGAKTRYRIRHVPIHRELLRLGFADYVRAVAKNGNTKLFPELYTIKSGGGTMFYARAWVNLVDAVDAQIRLPRTSDGKRADFHSLRTYSESILASIDASQAHIDRILGHASDGTGAKHYNRRMHVIGIDKYLEELRTLMEDSFVVVTGHLQPTGIKLLPLEHRSRTGAA